MHSTKGRKRALFKRGGSGSAPIAHAAAKTKDSASEGMVSLLEPFIDTILICTLTGLVILSSGVWVEKHENTFQEFDTEILSGNWSDSAEADRIELFHYLNGGTSKVSKMGVDSPVQIAVLDGKIQQSITILHNRSIAEGVEVLEDGSPYTGTLTVDRGAILEDVDLKGYSLIHSASLTAEAFTRSAMGDLGRPVVALVLLLFAFTTAVAWSYYGDRAVAYLFGTRWLVPYRLTYVVGFLLAISDTSLIWLIAAITVALMTIPNLIAILLLRVEVKALINDYWNRMQSPKD